MGDNAQRISLRVYYEDTDFSGRVYHASYLRFLERGRTEWLRAMGLSHDALAKSSGVAFAVTRLETDFLAPAFIDDWLDIETEVISLRGPVLRFQQTVLRDAARLVVGSVNVVAIKGDRPVRPPRELIRIVGSASRQ